MKRCALFMVLLLVLAACGLQADESPRSSSQELADELRLGQLPEPSSQGPGADQVHLVQNGRLVTVERQIVNTPEELMEGLLLSTFPAERAAGIRSALEDGAEVQNIEVAALSNVAIVDLAPGSLDANRDEQRIAFAQIVYTLTWIPEIEGVQFVQTDPDNPGAGAIGLTVQTDNGSTLPGAQVTRTDFARLSPVPQAPQLEFDSPVTTPTPTPNPDAPPTEELVVWMLDQNDQLTTVTRNIEQSANAIIIALLNGVVPNERLAGLRSAVPPDALANSVSVDTFSVPQSVEAPQNVEVPENDEAPDSNEIPESTEIPENTEVPESTEVPEDDEAPGLDSQPILVNIANVNLTAGSLPPVNDGDERYLAAAQIVYTLTSLDEIDEVVFSVDGFPITMPWDQGESSLFNPNDPEGLSRMNYLAVAPEGPRSEPIATPVQTPTPDPTPGG